MEGTSVIVRKLPKGCGRDQMVKVMNREGFFGAYDLIYAPMDFATHTGLGYSFVNLTTKDNALRFIEHFQGFSNWTASSEKACEVSLSKEIQGLEAHVERYRSSPVMHEYVPDEFKPAMFANGLRVEFPAPTKPIKQPRLRASRQKLKTSRRLEADSSSQSASSGPAIRGMAVPVNDGTVLGEL